MSVFYESVPRTFAEAAREATYGSAPRETRHPHTGAHACGCIGPQRGEPLCPCAMRGVTVRNGRYVYVERDLGPVPGASAREDADLFHKLFWDAVMDVRTPGLEHILGDQRVGVGPRKPRVRVKAGRRVVP